MAAKMDIYNYSSDQAMNQVTMSNCDASSVDDLVYWVMQSDGNENSYQIGDLEENHNYSITMYGLNRYGMSAPSNTINIKI